MPFGIPSPDDIGDAVDKAGEHLIQDLSAAESKLLNALLDRLNGTEIEVNFKFKLNIPPAK